jgi:hypothetical protein
MFRAPMNRARLWKLVAFAPIVVVLYANVMFVRNHFYVSGPYYHDSGWFSETVFRAGIIPRNPPHSAMPYYWGWHITAIVSLGSILSYLFPGDRVDWYCLFQGAIYAPLALAMPLLVPARARSGARSALLVAACSLAFAFDGQVLACIGYPHFEIFASAGIAIMLGALAMGRERLAWVGLAMAIGTREDCGFHAASLLVAVLAADVLGRPFPIARARLLRLAAAGLAATVLMMVVQKKVFISVDAFRMYITGDPPYAHLTGRVIAERLVAFAERCAFIWWPMVGTALVAVARRDARYLLGWVVTLPWLVLNLTAAQDVKAAVAVYTGFPFIGSIFWVAAYGRVEEDARTPRRRWSWPLLAGGFVSVVSTLGLLFSYQSIVVTMLEQCFVPSATNPAGIRAFAGALRAREYGAIIVDPAVASWALEGVLPSEHLSETDRREGVTRGDGVAFFLTGERVGLVIATAFTQCGRVPDTSVFFCKRPGSPLPPTVVPAPPLLVSALQLGPAHVRRDRGVIVADATVEPGIATFGPYTRLPAGDYVATWDIAVGACLGDAPPRRIHVDVFAGGHGLLATRDVPPSGGAIDVPFTVAPDRVDDAIELRTWLGTCASTVRALDVSRTPR